MKTATRPVVAFKDDIDTWVYFDQAFQVFRYEIFCIDYDEWGCPATLSFVIEEGIISAQEHPEVRAHQKQDEDLGVPSWIFWQGNLGFLPQQNINYHPLDSSVLRVIENRLKAQSRQRIMGKLRHLGYDVIAAVS